MTAITRNLPSVVRDLGVSIIGKECYISLVENLQLGDTKCLKYSLSKGLGIGIVAGGSIMKVPQILLILNARSARGLSLPAYILETLSYAITLTYSFRNNYPFSTYGENFFLTLQNVFITFLIVAYAPRLTDKSQKLGTTALATIATFSSLYLVPDNTLALLQMGTLPLSLFSKLPQIRQNARTHSTGQLSAFAVISQIAGCLARLFTTATEVNDWIVAAGFALALLLNLVLGFQMYIYWPKAEKGSYYPPVSNGFSTRKQEPSEEKFVPAYNEPAIEMQPIQQRNATPPPRTPSSTGRRWSRKVD